MPIDLGRRLISAGAVSPAEVEAALFLSVVRGVPFARVLVERGAITERALAEELERFGGLGLRQIAVVGELVDKLPRSMCRRLGAVPARYDPATGTVDVAAADPLDPHVATEFGFHLGLPVRVVGAGIGDVEEALRMLELSERRTTVDTAVRPRRATPAFPHGAPQSTIPPPPTEEAPIPLVRRLGLPLIESEPVTQEAETRKVMRASAAEEPEVVLPLRLTKPEPRNEQALPRGQARTGDRPAPTQPTNRSTPEPPPVSFPSEPPPPSSVTRVGIGDLSGMAARLEAAREAAREPPGRVAPPSVPTQSEPTLPAARGPEPAPRATSSPVVVQEGVRGGRPAIVASIQRPPAPTLMSATGSGASPSPPPPPEPPKRGTLPPPFGALDNEDTMRTIGLLRTAASRDEVVRLSLRGLRRAARRVAIFAVKRNAFQGWACNVEFGDEETFKDVAIPTNLPSVLATASASSLYLGPIPPTSAHTGLREVMTTATGDVAVIAVRVGGKPAMILLADELENTMLGTRHMDELARAAGDALSRLLGTR